MTVTLMTDQPRPHYPLWDLPTRLFHWGLVLLLANAWLSVRQGWMEIHRWNGYALLALLGFRLLWGWFGSRHARFSDFLYGPRQVWRYLRGQPVVYGGHNPAGGWAVLAMLLLLLIQGVTGLFATDEILFEGPLYPAVSSGTAEALTRWHKLNFDLVLALVGLHLAALAVHRLLKGEPLIVAMWTGRHPQRRGREAPVPLWRALLALAASAGLVAGMLALAPAPVSSYF
jgi:cytochrome b